MKPFAALKNHDSNEEATTKTKDPKDPQPHEIPIQLFITIQNSILSISKMLQYYKNQNIHWSVGSAVKAFGFRKVFDFQDCGNCIGTCSFLTLLPRVRSDFDGCKRCATILWVSFSKDTSYRQHSVQDRHFQWSQKILSRMTFEVT